MTETARFECNWVSPPGDTIADALEEQGITQAEFARRAGFSRKHVNGLIRGNVAITAETALKLEAVLGMPASFWLRREAEYREDLARQRALEEAAPHVEWLEEFPLAEMARLGWIRRHREKPLQVLELLRFFGVASVEAWEAQFEKLSPAFRASAKFASRRGAVSAWLRAAELEAQRLRLQPFRRGSLLEAIPQLRKLTNEADPARFVPALQEACARCGVAVVFVPAPRGCPASGATWWAAPDRAVLALSLRYRTNDHLWFSFFHELGHLVRHGKKLRFLEGQGLEGLDEAKEREADAFARRALIPDDSVLGEFTRGAVSEKQVRSVARRLGIAPGILVGRLQHDGILPYTHLNGLKVRYEWATPTRE